jgi:hypothetical protein
MPFTLAHPLIGLFSFCLPASFLVYLVFELWLRVPLVSLLPNSVQKRIRPLTIGVGFRSLPIILGSLLIGAFTHILWDSITHAWSPWLALKPILNYELFAVGSYQVFVFRALQHSSTLTGLAFIGWWIRRWYLTTEPILSTSLIVLTRRQIVVAFVLTSVIAAIVGRISGSSAIGSKEGLLALQYFSVKAVIAAINVYCLALGVYCVWWYWQNARESR